MKTAIAAAFALAIFATPAQASPLESLAALTHVGFCVSQYGLVTEEASIDMIFDIMREDEGLELHQIKTLLDHPSFEREVDRAKGRLGNCRTVVDGIKANLGPKGEPFVRPAYLY
jgi:hypothetical protein